MLKFVIRKIPSLNRIMNKITWREGARGRKELTQDAGILFPHTENHTESHWHMQLLWLIKDICVNEKYLLR